MTLGALPGRGSTTHFEGEYIVCFPFANKTLLFSPTSEYGACAKAHDYQSRLTALLGTLGLFCILAIPLLRLAQREGRNPQHPALGSQLSGFTSTSQPCRSSRTAETLQRSVLTGGEQSLPLLVSLIPRGQAAFFFFKSGIIGAFSASLLNAQQISSLRNTLPTDPLPGQRPRALRESPAVPITVLRISYISISLQV